jgi:adenylate cyclase
MAVFGAPVPDEQHADHALAAAQEMAGPALKRFEEEFTAAHGEPVEPFRIGIGLNSGVVTSGSIGSGARIEYTAVGDTTNQASRIEKLTKSEQVPILLGQTTYERLTDADDLRCVGPRELDGVAEPVILWSLDGAGRGAASGDESDDDTLASEPVAAR